MSSDIQFCGTVYVISLNIALILSSSENRDLRKIVTCVYHSKTWLVKHGTFLFEFWKDSVEKMDILNTGNSNISVI